MLIFSSIIDTFCYFFSFLLEFQDISMFAPVIIFAFTSFIVYIMPILLNILSSGRSICNLVPNLLSIQLSITIFYFLLCCSHLFLPFLFHLFLPFFLPSLVIFTFPEHNVCILLFSAWPHNN